MDKQMHDEMETGIVKGLIGFRVNGFTQVPRVGNSSGPPHRFCGPSSNWAKKIRIVFMCFRKL